MFNKNQILYKILKNKITKNSKILKKLKNLIILKVGIEQKNL